MIGKEFYGNYIVYPNGIIYNINSKKELKQRIVNKYKVVTLFMNKKRKDFKVHRLVAVCFVSNLENKTFVNHIDGDKFNNNSENLEWCTHIENIKHAMENNLMNNKGELNPSSKLKKEDVNNIKKLYETKEYSHRGLAKKFKISKTQITRVINNKSWQYESNTQI
jgi:hypothetical protein